MPSLYRLTWTLKFVLGVSISKKQILNIFSINMQDVFHHTVMKKLYVHNRTVSVVGFGKHQGIFFWGIFKLWRSPSLSYFIFFITVRTTWPTYNYVSWLRKNFWVTLCVCVRERERWIEYIIPFQSKCYIFSYYLRTDTETISITLIFEVRSLSSGIVFGILILFEVVGEGCFLFSFFYSLNEWMVVLKGRNFHMLTFSCTANSCYS